MGLPRKAKITPLEDRMEKELLNQREKALKNPFGFAEYNHVNAERTGYSDYSYWKSTIRIFLRNQAPNSQQTIYVLLHREPANKYC